MQNLVVALSGSIGAGKGELGKRLAGAIDADRVSFGAEVRRYTQELGEDAGDIGTLQEVGQSLVLTQPSDFVRRVLAQRQREGVPLIVEGLRHVEILLELREQTKGSTFRLFHVEVPAGVRATRIMARDGVERRLTARYDANINEEQASRILPQYADASVNGELPVSLQVARVLRYLDLDAGSRSPYSSTSTAHA